MRIGRLLTADVTAVADRGRQEIQRSFDRLLVSGKSHVTAGLSLFDHLAAEPEDTRHDLKRRKTAETEFSEFCRHGPDRIFAGLRDESVNEYFSRNLLSARADIIAAADAVCEHRFNLLGHRVLNLGKQIDWHRDKISGRRAPFVHWSRINTLDPDSVGDSKFTWELSRQHWLLDLGQAYRLSGDERYAREFGDLLRDWMRSNPPGMGINWASSLEVSYRMIAWCWALHLFRDSRELTPAFFAKILGWMRVHAAHVEKYLSHYFSPNTHLTGEALGLVYAGVLFPSFSKARRWRRLGVRILLEQLHAQVLPDGVYFEQSVCYQRYTAEIYLHFLILAARHDIPVPDTAVEKIHLLLDYLVSMRRPDGSLPQIGDTDGGSLLPLVRRCPTDGRGVFSVAAVLFRRPEYARAADGVTPELFWLLGPVGCAAFDDLYEKAHETPGSKLFPDGGYALMQGGCGRNAHQLVFDVGPLGCPVSGGHGHADLLSVQCSTFGEAQLVDAGTYCYTGHQEWRDYFRSSAAHSTVLVDGKSQAVPSGPFAWQKRPHAKLHRWVSTQEWDYADASHDAYRHLADPVVHRRRVLFIKPRFWLVVDDLDGGDVHDIELLFQFCPLDLSLQDSNWASSLGPGGHGLFIRPFTSDELKAEIQTGQRSPIRGWVSTDYGLRTPAPLLVYSAHTQLPMRVVTLLLPRTCVDIVPPEVAAEFSNGSTKIAFCNGSYVINVDGRIITIDDAENGRSKQIIAG